MGSGNEVEKVAVRREKIARDLVEKVKNLLTNLETDPKIQKIAKVATLRKIRNQAEKKKSVVKIKKEQKIAAIRSEKQVVAKKESHLEQLMKEVENARKMNAKKGKKTVG